MQIDRTTLGILGLQVAVIAGTTAILEELAPAAEGTMVVLMWASLLITLSAFFVDESPSDQH